MNKETRLKIIGVLQRAERKVSKLSGQNANITIDYSPVKTISNKEMAENMNSVFKAVEQVTGITQSHMASPSRKGEICDARFIFSYEVKNKWPKTTLKTIGKMMGVRDHSTIDNQINRCADLMITDSKFELAFKKVRQILDNN